MEIVKNIKNLNDTLKFDTNKCGINIYITNQVLNDFIIINDTKLVKINWKKKYILVFTTGKITLQIFKQFYMKKRDVYFCVKNMELFFYKMKDFKILNFIYFDEKDTIIKNKIQYYENKYLEVETKFKKKMCSDFKTDNKGIMLSFNPDIYRSIHTSLINPGIYKSKKMPCHILYEALLVKPMKYTELKNLIKSSEFESALKSLIYCNIIKQKGDIFFINNILLPKQLCKYV